MRKTIDETQYDQLLNNKIKEHADLITEIYNESKKKLEEKYKGSGDYENRENSSNNAITDFFSYAGNSLEITNKINNLLKLTDTKNVWPLIVILLIIGEFSDKTNNYLNNNTLSMLGKNHKKALLDTINQSKEFQALVQHKLNPVFDPKKQGYTYHFKFPLFFVLSLNKSGANLPSSKLTKFHDETPTTNSGKALLHMLGLTTQQMTQENEDTLYKIATNDASFEDQMNKLLETLPDDATKLTAVKNCIALGQHQQTLGNFILSTDLLAVLLASLSQQDHALDKASLDFLSQKTCKQQLLFAIEQHPQVFQDRIKNKNTLLDVVIDHQKYTPGFFKTASKTRHKVEACMQTLQLVNQPQ
ncbi:MAG TPA: hypothetical protein VFU82_02820 [Gammaproteobacteria bacterium]|nr:hypothetical protein [Gammaproteobacteria bacterium]